MRDRRRSYQSNQEVSDNISEKRGTPRYRRAKDWTEKHRCQRGKNSQGCLRTRASPQELSRGLIAKGWYQASHLRRAKEKRAGLERESQGDYGALESFLASKGGEEDRGRAGQCLEYRQLLLGREVCGEVVGRTHQGDFGRIQVRVRRGRAQGYIGRGLEGRGVGQHKEGEEDCRLRLQLQAKVGMLIQGWGGKGGRIDEGPIRAAWSL